MKILLDTNIIMDALQERQPFDADAKEILRRGQTGEIECLFTANAATDIFFLYDKSHGAATARRALHFLLTQYGVVSVTQADCIEALALPIENFEDALVAYCAKKAAVDYIVTRDAEFAAADAPVKIIKPKVLLELLHHS
jgi:predicted nucleic acid-binding protein